MDRFSKNPIRGLKRKMFDISSSEFGSCKKHFNKVKYGGKLGGREVEVDYAWLLDYLTQNDEQTEVSEYENENEDENRNENEIDENEDENENENEYENDIEYANESEDENDKDPHYCMFLKKLTENGQSYILEVFQNDVTWFQQYEKDEKSDGYDDHQICSNDSNGDRLISCEDVENMQIDQRANSRLHETNGEILTMKEVSGKKKINEHISVAVVPHQGITVDSCYQVYLNGCLNSEYGAFKYEGKLVKYEEKVTSSDSDIQVLDNVQDFSEVNNKAPSLKQKLIRILKKPYNEKEYEELLKYVSEQKPICRLLPLRHRSISSALDGATKSLLDDSPGCFRRKLDAAQNEPSKALNLLRMFRFWLEYVPNEDVFEPWLDKKILEVQPTPITK